jgi:hypothetical protein
VTTLEHVLKDSKYIHNHDGDPTTSSKTVTETMTHTFGVSASGTYTYSSEASAKVALVATVKAEASVSGTVTGTYQGSKAITASSTDSKTVSACRCTAYRLFVDVKSTVRYKLMGETFNCGEHPAGPGENPVYMMDIETINGDANGHDNESAVWEDFEEGGKWAQSWNSNADCYCSEQLHHYD